MFDKEKFALILKNIKESYSSQEEFSKYSKVGRTYISQYMNCKMDSPPKPKILEKIANSSKGFTNYDELMQICGYTNYIIDDFFGGSIQNNGREIPIIDIIRYDSNTHTYITIPTQKYAYTNIDIDPEKEYIAVVGPDDSMSPLIGKNDMVIVEKTNKLISGKVYLLCLNDRIVIRKIIKLENETFELEPFNMRYPKEVLQNIQVIGEVASVEIKSAFL